MQKQLEVTDISHDGRGVARDQGKIHFVEGALGGETVIAQRIASHARYDEWRVTEILAASPSRVEPFCPVYAACGGCALQHCSHAAQRESKRSQIVQQLQRIAKLTPLEVLPDIESEAQGYRRRTRLAINPIGPRVQVGFRERGGKRIVEFDTCPILRGEINSVIKPLRTLIETLQCRKALGHIEIVVDDDHHCGVVLRVTSVMNESDAARVAEFSAQHDCVFVLLEGKEKTSTRILSSRKSLRYVLDGGCEISFTPTDFLQGNAEVNRHLVKTALEWLMLDGSQSVLELYSGIGNFSMPLSARCKKLTLLEIVPDMVDRARQWIAQQQLAHVEALVADLDAEQLPHVVRKQTFDRVLLDPPRDGAKLIINAVAKLKAEVIVYVSCNPATLARDAGVLADHGYVLDKLVLADMFPHTEHAECIARFVQKRRIKPSAQPV